MWYVYASHETCNLLAVQNVQLLPTKAQPSVYADWLKADGAPTVLVYGHYGERLHARPLQVTLCGCMGLLIELNMLCRLCHGPYAPNGNYHRHWRLILEQVENNLALQHHCRMPCRCTACGSIAALEYASLSTHS